MQVIGHIATLRQVQIDRDSQDFPYEQLAQIVRARILSGEYQPGKRAPSLAELIDESGLNMTTVQRAMHLLRDEGYLIIRPGRGTFVAAREDWPDSQAPRQPAED